MSFDKEKFFDKIKLRDQESLACLSYYYKVLGDDEIGRIQQLTTEYSQAKAETFFKDNKAFFDVEENRVDFFRFMSSIHADRPHSGKRFSEELYKIVWAYAKNLSAQKAADAENETVR